MLPLVGAALLGGAVVALVIIVLALAGFFRPIEERTDYGPEIATLKSDVAALKTAPAPPTVDLSPLNDRVAALEKSVSALQESASSASAPDTAALGAVQDRVTQVEQGLEQLKSQLASAPAPASSDSGTALAQQVAALSDQVDALRKGNASADISGLKSAVEELRKKLDALSTEVAKVPQEARVAAIETRLNKVGGEADRAAALAPAVAADALAAAVNAGRPFTQELAALQTLGIDSKTVAALKPDAASGLPTLAALRARFETVIAKVDLTMPMPEGGTALDRLVESARSLVKVRPAHPTAGSDPAAIVTRIRGALAAEDLKTALAEWQTLPDNVKAATDAWAKSAETRKTADDLVARLRAEALARLDSEG